MGGFLHLVGFFALILGEEAYVGQLLVYWLLQKHGIMLRLRLILVADEGAGGGLLGDAAGAGQVGAVCEVVGVGVGVGDFRVFGGVAFGGGLDGERLLLGSGEQLLRLAVLRLNHITLYLLLPRHITINHLIPIAHPTNPTPLLPLLLQQLYQTRVLLIHSVSPLRKSVVIINGGFRLACEVGALGSCGGEEELGLLVL